MNSVHRLLLFTLLACTYAGGTGIVDLRCQAFSAAAESSPSIKYKSFTNVPLNQVPFLGIKDMATALRKDLDRISTDFAAAPDTALDHVLDGVIYADWVSNSHKLNGGMHSLEGRRRLLQVQLSDAGFSIDADQNRAEIERQQRVILDNPTGVPHSEMKALGLDPANIEDVYFYLLAHHSSHMGPQIEDNGVVRFQFGRAVYNSKKWKKSVQGAEMGRAPAGAKTLFPANWPRDKVKAAIIGVLSDEKTRILSLGSSADRSGIRSMLIEGEFEGVVITIAIDGGRVVTAYPSWTQDRTKTVGEVAAERNHHRRKVWDRVWDLNEALKVSTPAPDLADAVAIYAGKKPEMILSGTVPLPDADYQLLSQYLSPAARPNGRKTEPLQDTEAKVYSLGSTSQYHIEHFLVNWRLVEDVNSGTR